MSDKNTASIQSLLRYSLPLGASIVAGDPETQVNWSVTIRAQPPVFPDIYGGELALVSMDVLRSFDDRLRLAGVIRLLSDIGVNAVLATGETSQSAKDAANECGTVLVSVPLDTSLTTVERAVNSLLLNQSARLTERAIEIQRQLTRLAAENRDLGSLLQVMSRSTGKPIVIHDDAGLMISQIYPNIGRRSLNGRYPPAELPLGDFQTWLSQEAPSSQGMITPSPLGFTTVLKVEKRVAGYLSLVDQKSELDEFGRLVLAYGADVCAIEMAKNRAIASAVEQARGDWIQMWLSGTPADEDLLRTRAQQAGFQPGASYVVSVFRAITESGQSLSLEPLISLVRDDMSRRQINGAVGQYVDVIVVLYPLDEDDAAGLSRTRMTIENVRGQISSRLSNGLIAAGISRPATGLSMLRDAYREAKDAVGISYQLSDRDTTTFYGDLKLFQLLLALKERNLDNLHQFYDDALGPLVEHDKRKQSDLIRTLGGFFEANGNLAKAAQALDVHRNTLVYRLERISELTKMDLDDSDNRLILHLALKTQRVLATIPGQSSTG
ncbi:MAG: helix-turn-helix domain-containing protein [Chloroflexi bacterium]|nr:helix-turn-helix domain-containing protein [Chloroflexota bacterium]